MSAKKTVSDAGGIEPGNESGNENVNDIENANGADAEQGGRAAAQRRLNAAIAPALKAMTPPENYTVSEWADAKRRLSAESSAEAGRWRTSRTPYLKDIMDAFNDPKVRRIVVVSSSQVGKSETINNIIGYIIDQDPGSILFILPTTIDAKEYSKLRLAPMIRDCACLRQKVSGWKSRDSGNTILQKSYPGGIITLCGSTEAHALASKPIRYVFGDERDRWATSAGAEGDPWKLASARQITFYNAKSVEVSTPTIKGASAIADSYESGTRERRVTMCPHCGEYSEIVFDNIRFEYNEIVKGSKTTYELTSLYYVCPKCGGVSDEAVMKKQSAKWEAQNPAAYENGGCRSFWLSSWVSPWASWSSTVIEFLEAKNDSRKLQVVYNTRFGQLWEDRGDLPNEDAILSRRERYAVEVPEGVLCLTCGMDTQDDRLEYEVVGHGMFGETWGIHKGEILGRPDEDDVWRQVDELLGREFESPHGPMRISLTFIDEGGHYTQDVRTRCLERQRLKIFPIKGRGGDGIPYTSAPKKQKIMYRGRAVGSCWVYDIGVDSGKQQIYDNLKVGSPGAKYCHFPDTDEYGERYFRGLLSERLVYRADRKNAWQWEKIPGHERNEPLDIRNYANAAFKALNPDMAALERRAKGITEQKEPPPSQRQKPKPKKKKKDFFNEW